MIGDLRCLKEEVGSLGTIAGVMLWCVQTSFLFICRYLCQHHYWVLMERFKKWQTILLVPVLHHPSRWSDWSCTLLTSLPKTPHTCMHTFCTLVVSLPKFFLLHNWIACCNQHVGSKQTGGRYAAASCQLQCTTICTVYVHVCRSMTPCLQLGNCTLAYCHTCTINVYTYTIYM